MTRPAIGYRGDGGRIVGISFTNFAIRSFCVKTNKRLYGTMSFAWPGLTKKKKNKRPVRQSPACRRSVETEARVTGFDVTTWRRRRVFYVKVDVAETDWTSDTSRTRVTRSVHPANYENVIGLVRVHIIGVLPCVYTFDGARAAFRAPRKSTGAAECKSVDSHS